MSEGDTEHRSDSVHAFIEHLGRLATREDRGALAALRRSLQHEQGMAPQACPYVVPFLPNEPDVYRERLYFLIGALFAMDPRLGHGGSLASAFSHLDREASGGSAAGSPSIRGRFAALLDAHPDDVGEHVRHAVSLARAKDVSIDWERLLRDLLAWRHPERPVQRRWARDFWGRTEATSQDANEKNEVKA
jgi:CRISPR system Cascade subunit CasB